MEHNIPFGNSNRVNGPTFLDFPLFLGIFQWDEPTKRVPFTAEPEIPEILTKWKAPHSVGYYIWSSLRRRRDRYRASNCFSQGAGKPFGEWGGDAFKIFSRLRLSLLTAKPWKWRLRCQKSQARKNNSASKAGYLWRRLQSGVWKSRKICHLRISRAFNRPFPSFPGPLFQNEGRRSAFDIGSFFILKQIEPIFTRKVEHLASFWKWGFLELGSGLLKHFEHAPYGSISLIEKTLHTTLSRHNEKESPFFNGRYTKGVPLLKKIVVHKRVRVGVLGAESVPVLNFDE